MGKEGVLERDGEVLEVLPAGYFKVRLKDVDTLVRCKKSGRMSQSNISIIPGDRVKMEINQYDMTQGRIIFRYNDYKHQIEPRPIQTQPTPQAPHRPTPQAPQQTPHKPL